MLIHVNWPYNGSSGCMGLIGTRRICPRILIIQLIQLPLLNARTLENWKRCYWMKICQCTTDTGLCSLWEICKQIKPAVFWQKVKKIWLKKNNNNNEEVPNLMMTKKAFILWNINISTWSPSLSLHFNGEYRCTSISS